ncbi:hypothetical protein AVEN_264281-1 [Araneus ventricosus]|uniref:Uncharacterized protein n=1 Tax=Araneus ventricosus TaxID=182803 RepID=A0A4Y2NXD0_ARAVE|nr:hypothetical protein AVEN_264281-1 [Araneus ventricosus]
MSCANQATKHGVETHVRVKAKHNLSQLKTMASVFWDRHGVLLVDFMQRGTTINAVAYGQTLRKLRRAIQNKRRGMLTEGIYYSMKMQGLTPQLRSKLSSTLLAGKFWTSPQPRPCAERLSSFTPSETSSRRQNHYNDDENVKTAGYRRKIL